MAIRALFFDIDGTLVSFKTHRIPPSTVASLTKAKEKGVKIFISTGRPTQFITNLQQIEHLIDGWVTTNGANCFIGTDTVHRKAMSRENVDHIIALSDKYQVPVIIVGSQDIASSRYTLSRRSWCCKYRFHQTRHRRSERSGYTTDDSFF